MYRRFFSIFKYFLLSLFLFQQVYASSALSPQLRTLLKSTDIQEIIQKGYIIVAMTQSDNPPFYMVDEKGNLIGHDVELAKTIAHLLNVRVEFNRNNTSFDDVVFMVAKGEADIGISKLSLTLPRAQIVLYTDPYITLHKAMIINRVGLTKFGSNLSIKNLFTTKAASIGVIDDSSYEDFSQYLFPDATHYTAPSWEQDIIPKIMKGELLGAFRDELVVRNTMLSVPNASIYLLAVILQDEPDPIMMIVNKKSYMLLQFLNLFLEYYYPKHSLDDIIVKYKSYAFKNTEKKS